MAALDEQSASQALSAPTISNQARTFVVDPACRKPKDFGFYPLEVWTTRLLAEHVREPGMWLSSIRLSVPVSPRAHSAKILAAPEVKPHKLRYYLERRDPDFDAKMAEVVSVYREVEQLKQAAKARSEETPAQTPAVAIISYDEKPGIRRRRSPTSARPAAQSPCVIGLSHAITNTFDWGRRACWPASIGMTGVDPRQRRAG